MASDELNREITCPLARRKKNFLTRYNHLLRYPLIFGIALFFVTLFSTSTGPINPAYGFDSAAFRFFGHALAEGMQAYVEIWDHKGPALFLIEWGGQLLAPGRVGIFALQTIFLFGTLTFLDNVARRFLTPLLRCATVLITLAFLVPAYQGGNLTEEFSLPFITLVMMLLSQEWTSHKPLTALAFALAGASFAFVIFIRVNNAMPILGFFVVYFVFALITRKRFWAPLAYSLAGFLAVTVAFLGWFTAEGSLKEMLFALVTFNSAYAGADGYNFNAILGTPYWLLALSALAVALIGGLVDKQMHGRNEFFALAWVGAAFTAVPIFMTTNGYLHYLQLAAPIASLGCILVLQSTKRSTQPLVMLVVAILTLPTLVGYGNRTLNSDYSMNETRYADRVEDILSKVPPEQRDEIYAWSLSPKFFLVSDLLPMQRFYFLQDKWSAIDPRVKSEIQNFLSETPPTWIITPAGDTNGLGVAPTLKSEYERVAQNDHFILFRLK